MKKIFFQNYIQYEIGLIHHQFIVIVNNGGIGVHSTVRNKSANKFAAKEENCAVSNAQNKTNPVF